MPKPAIGDGGSREVHSADGENVSQITSLPSAVQVSRSDRREIALYDGRTFLGRVVMLRGGSFRAITTDRVLGDFSEAASAYTAAEKSEVSRQRLPRTCNASSASARPRR
jgi:hypothetical protein